MQLGYVIVYVEDVGRALDFYKQAFGLVARFTHESGMYGELDTGSTVLAFAQLGMLKMNTGLVADQRPCNSFEIALVTSDVDAALERALAAGAEQLAAPADKPWGQRVGYVRDPFGVIVEICTSVS